MWAEVNNRKNDRDRLFLMEKIFQRVCADKVCLTEVTGGERQRVKRFFTAESDYFY